MAKINILSEVICNRIAAGEVIDRPYSAVKEMIEQDIRAVQTDPVQISMFPDHLLHFFRNAFVHKFSK